MLDCLYNLATDKYRGPVAAPFKFFLFIISIIYGLIIRMLILFYRFKPHHLKCKVISVGNITWGGTGKTPLVEYIARYLRQTGHKVAILTRGHKIKVKSLADEPHMLSKKLGDIPIIVDKDRIKASDLAISKYGVDAVILDDGFQQWRIKKDLEIVTIDAANPFGNKHLIPRGILREPLSFLRRADIFIFTKTNIKAQIQDIKNRLSKINPRALIFESIHKPLGFYKVGRSDEALDIGALKGKTVTLFSGIADPGSFERLVTDLGVKVGLSFGFRDHYCYTEQDLNNIIRCSKDRDIDTLVTTEKDVVRIQGLQLEIISLQLLFLRIELSIKEDEQRLHSRLLSLYNL